MESECKATGGWGAAAHLNVVMRGCLGNMSSHLAMLLSFVDLYDCGSNIYVVHEYWV